MKIKFRCPPELEDALPRPYPAKRGLPEWLKAMPMAAQSPDLGREINTVKHCPPFIDAMSYGFIMPLMTDLRVENGLFEWDWEPGRSDGASPVSGLGNYPQSPIGFHVNSQVANSPFYSEEEAAIKFFNLWTIELPPGYSLLVSHPVNRPDLPFHTLSGLVDCDRYYCTMVHFPAIWKEPMFSGTLPKGTPVAQCVPVKRDIYELEFEGLSGEAEEEFAAFHRLRKDDPNIYKNRYRVKKN